jgi:hypothetical protein
MSSSIFTSKAGWRRFLIAYAAWLLAIGLALGASVIALDPYDTGRFALFGEHGVPPFGQRLADAGLGRQPQFDTVILGNSTLQLIDPARLDKAGLHAVSLAIPGTGPREQLTIAQWFLRHHPGDKTRALIIGISQRWCEANDDLELTHPFPFWLYGEDGSDYLVNMMQFQSLESAGRKIGLMLGQGKALPADGYNDYDVGKVWDRAGFLERVSADVGKEKEEPELNVAPPYRFEAVKLLKDFFAHAPEGMAVVLVMPPQFHPDIGLRRSNGAQHRACADAFEALAAERPRTKLIDFLTQSDLTSREDDYWDRYHYRARVARVMEETIEDALKHEE